MTGKEVLRMTNLYWNMEADKVETGDSIKADYFDMFASDYDNFSDYLSACMYWNNGALIPLREKIDRIERRLARYGDMLEADEIEELTAELAELNRLYIET